MRAVDPNNQYKNCKYFSPIFNKVGSVKRPGCCGKIVDVDDKKLAKNFCSFFNSETNINRCGSCPEFIKK
jgi:hypothetical protein